MLILLHRLLTHCTSIQEPGPALLQQSLKHMKHMKEKEQEKEKNNNKKKRGGVITTKSHKLRTINNVAKSKRDNQSFKYNISI